ncbi:MAG: 2OG-Fe(II) oxygenase [Bdellovibrionales bacterium]
MLDLSLLAATPVIETPFPYMTASHVLAEGDLRQVGEDFPHIDKPGIFPLSELRFGGAFTHLIEDIHSTKLESLMEEKFGIDLSDKPLMITVRGHCQKKDGRIHTDSKDKIVTCLLYLNAPSWDNQNGRLRFLRDDKNIDDAVAEIPPAGGNFVAFRRTENSWHGHTPFVGPRRYIMFNWIRSDVALAKNLGRHKLSAAFKRLGLFQHY